LQHDFGQQKFSLLFAATIKAEQSWIPVAKHEEKKSYFHGIYKMPADKKQRDDQVLWFLLCF